MSAMWKLEKDLCRCCHAEGSFKHLSDPCFLLGQEEIYSVMLQDCLDIKIVPMTGPLCDATYTICESCVARLRDASNFKRQVQDCEERFKEMYSKNMIKGFAVKDEPCESDADMKQEFQSVEEDEDDDDAFMKFDDEGDDASSYEEHEEMISVEIEAESSAKGKGKAKAKPKPKPKKAPVKKTKSKEKPIKVETEELTEAAVSGEKKKDEERHHMKGCFKCKKIRKVEELGDTKTCPDCGTVLTNCFVRLVREQLQAGPITNFFITTEEPVNNGQAKSEPQAAGSSASEPAPASVLRDFLLRGLAGNSKQDENESGKTVDSQKMKKEDSDDDSLESLDMKQEDFEVYGCMECQKTFSKKTSLQKHIRNLHRKVLLKCPDCADSFPTKRTLQNHVKKVHDKNTGPEKDTRYKTFIRVIQGEPPDEDIYACKLCDRKFCRLMEITAHTKVHARKLTCPVCFKFIPDPEEYKRHKAQPHPDAKKFTCQACKCVYNTIFELRKHKKAAHYRYKCPHCQEMLTKNSLHKHLRQFHSESLLACGICDFKSSQQFRVIQHQKIVHLKEKNVICDICQFPFYSTTELRKHMVSHKAEKMFECGHCKKKFARKSTLSLHEKIHTGEKNKICAVCGAAFVQKASLNYHMVKHHPDRV
ncbi:zinc finger protein 26-like isoform X8 [Cydia pomonella]|uniref:zinc finger protein 26-like isoform X8 n=1 Tax=Cydia pomonella TaxID=82600 RepID=UPI002ADDCC3D|nr:zinc finger protein 26-like isoform X8 [Cydia pomonella]